MKSPIDQMAHVLNHERKVRSMFKGETTERFVPTGKYDGAELRAFTGRPGAMDAFSCPSLRNGKRIPYVGPRSQCVGDLKDKRDHSGD